MEEEIILVLLSRSKEQKLSKIKRRRKLKQLRDKSDPFSMPDVTFIKMFRLPKWLCLEIFKELEPHDQQGSSIPLMLRFLATLYLYANGSYQSCVGNNFMVSMSQPSISRSLDYITKLLVSTKSNEIKFPTQGDEMIKIKTGFYQNYGIKGTIGAIDCTHVAIVAPPSNDTANPTSLYMNRKSFYSVNVEAVCDDQLIFNAVNAKFPGSCHDSGIWTTSDVRLQLIQNHSSQQDTWLLGDQGYPLEPWLLTPVGTPSSNKEEKFNKLHCSARNTIERAFGLLKSRFRCLLRHSVLHYSHEKVAYIVFACAILHNVMIKKGERIDDVEIEVDATEIDSSTIVSNHFREGQRIRSRYINTLLTNVN